MHSEMGETYKVCIQKWEKPTKYAFRNGRHCNPEEQKYIIQPDTYKLPTFGFWCIRTDGHNGVRAV